MTNLEQLQKDIYKLIELSSMEDDERMMWMVMVPSMTEEELVKFKPILEKEVNKLTDIYTKAIKK
jgi:hypothetical protein